jgi:putative ABC transport system substrate-binding protein
VRIIRLTRTLVLAVAFIGLNLIACTNKRADAEVSIAYVGSWNEASDRVYKRFREALARRHPDLNSRVTYRHFQADAGNTSAIDHALRQAISSKPTVFVTPTGESAGQAAKLATSVPFVFSSYADPVQAGIRDSLHLSHLNNTGISLKNIVDGKRLEILKDAFPSIQNVAVLADGSWANGNGGEGRVAEAAAKLGLKLTMVLAEDEDQLDTEMLKSSASRFDAWYVPPSYIAYVAERKIISHILRLRLPAIHSTAGEVRAGALMAYEQDTSFAMNSIADLVARVCAGEHAGSIPVERPHRFTLMVRLHSAPNMPRPSAHVIRRADFVIR